MIQVDLACADCLEGAGGRQLQHGISWQVDSCGCCGQYKALTNPVNFGNPRLSPKVLPLHQPKLEGV